MCLINYIFGGTPSTTTTVTVIYGRPASVVSEWQYQLTGVAMFKHMLNGIGA